MMQFGNVSLSWHWAGLEMLSIKGYCLVTLCDDEADVASYSSLTNQVLPSQCVQMHWTSFITWAFIPSWSFINTFNIFFQYEERTTLKASPFAYMHLAKSWSAMSRLSFWNVVCKGPFDLLRVMGASLWGSTMEKKGWFSTTTLGLDGGLLIYRNYRRTTTKYGYL